MFTDRLQIWNPLIREAQNSRLASAYLFYGLSGSGKKRLACDFVQYLFCLEKNKTEPVACGACAPCTQVLHDNHPDFYFIVPQGKSISIDVIRELKKSLGRTTFSAPLKAVVIDDAQEMTAAAANSLLKTLEEPVGEALFILTAPHLSQMLPTIRSRCRKIFFSFTVESEPSESMKESLSQWAQLHHAPFSRISKLSQEWSAADFDLILFLETIKRNIFDEMKEKKQWSRVDELDRLSQAQKDLDRNVNKQLVLENLILDILG